MPIEIESVLSLHDEIQEVIVVGKPDERLGQQIVAFIVSQTKVSSTDLYNNCRSHGLPGYRCPRSDQFVHEIPKSPVGKILRRQL